MLVDDLKAMCHVPWLVTFDPELWSEGQTDKFCIALRSWPGCNFFVGVCWWLVTSDLERRPQDQHNDSCKEKCVWDVWCMLLIFSIRVDQLKMMCHVPKLVIFYFKVKSMIYAWLMYRIFITTGLTEMYSISMTFLVINQCDCSTCIHFLPS